MRGQTFHPERRFAGSSRRAFVFGAGAAFVALSRTSRAHTFPSRLLVQVQAEPDALVTMITHAPEASAADLYEVASAWRGDARARLEATLAEAALDAVALELDGAPLARPDRVDTKLFEQPPRSGRHAVAVLLEKRLDAKAHSLVVTADATLLWIDRSEGRASSSVAPETRTSAPLTLTWKARA